jgi:hypothetical protein
MSCTRRDKEELSAADSMPATGISSRSHVIEAHRSGRPKDILHYCHGHLRGSTTCRCGMITTHYEEGAVLLR